MWLPCPPLVCSVRRPPCRSTPPRDPRSRRRVTAAGGRVAACSRTLGDDLSFGTRPGIRVGSAPVCKSRAAHPDEVAWRLHVVARLSGRSKSPTTSQWRSRRSHPTCWAEGSTPTPPARWKPVDFAPAAPSAALVEGGARGELVRSGLVGADDRHGRVLVLFGRRPTVGGGWPQAAAGRGSGFSPSCDRSRERPALTPRGRAARAPRRPHRPEALRAARAP